MSINLGVPDEITEFEDSQKLFEKKSDEFLKLVMSAKHIVVFTGAGISTQSGLPDYRSPNGVWTLKEKGMVPKATATIQSAKPTFTHMALKSMLDKGFVHHIVSTNVDGLHMRSGIESENLSELHGNSFKEYCSKCKAEYLRDFDCTFSGCRKDHKTGRQCEKCSSDLLDSIIHFGENLPEKPFMTASAQTQKSDLVIVLGTSMRVKPACELPLLSLENGGKMVIVNKQKTPFDMQANVRLFCSVDKIMKHLSEALGIEVDYKQSESSKENNENNENNNNNENSKSVPYNPKVEIPKGIPQLLHAKESIHRIKLNEGENKTIEMQGGSTVIIHDSKKSKITIKGRCVKVLIDSCQEMEIEINASVLTSLEIVRCKQVKLISSNTTSGLNTISVDLSEDVTFEMSQSLWLGRMYSSKCVGIKVSLPNKPIHNAVAPISVDDEIEEEMDFSSQEITLVSKGSLITERVVREGNGYLTTKKEKEMKDKLQQKNEEAMSRYMKTLIGTKQK